MLGSLVEVGEVKCYLDARQRGQIVSEGRVNGECLILGTWAGLVRLAGRQQPTV